MSTGRLSFTKKSGLVLLHRYADGGTLSIYKEIDGNFPKRSRRTLMLVVQHEVQQRNKGPS
jgi:hypothetical protein